MQEVACGIHQIMSLRSSKWAEHSSAMVPIAVLWKPSPLSNQGWQSLSLFPAKAESCADSSRLGHSWRYGIPLLGLFGSVFPIGPWQCQTFLDLPSCISFLLLKSQINILVWRLFKTSWFFSNFLIGISRNKPLAHLILSWHLFLREPALYFGGNWKCRSICGV